MPTNAVFSSTSTLAVFSLAEGLTVRRLICQWVLDTMVKLPSLVLHMTSYAVQIQIAINASSLFAKWFRVVLFGIRTTTRVWGSVAHVCSGLPPMLYEWMQSCLEDSESWSRVHIRAIFSERTKFIREEKITILKCLPALRVTPLSVLG